MSHDYSGIERFVLCIEHLEVTRELLKSRSPAKERMAVILLDGLTDAFLYRRLAALYRLVEEGWWYRARMPSYPKELRDRARAEFHTRLKLAREVTYYDEISFQETPFIDDVGATILQIGHTYRNDAYHRDRHNPEVIGVIGRLMFAAVSDLFTRAQPEGVAVSLSPGQAARLREHGVEVSDDDFFRFKEAAGALARSLNSDLKINLDDLAEQLAADLEYRVDQVEDSLEHLRSSGRDIDEILSWHEFAYKHGDDQQLLDLAEKMDPASRAQKAGMTAIPPEFTLEAERAPGLYFKRRDELMSAMRCQVTVEAVMELRRQIEPVRGISRKSKLLSRYHEKDRLLNLIEDCASDALEAFDEMVQRQIDEARGR